VPTNSTTAAASREAIKRNRRPKVLGVRLPRELRPRNLDPKKLTDGVDLKRVVKQIGDAAEQVEARSEDLRMLSAQAKRLSRKLS
jgi:hypothetical protein